MRVALVSILFCVREINNEHARENSSLNITNKDAKRDIQQALGKL